MVIAVDFDGTLVSDQYPAIGNEIPFAIETLKKIQLEGKYKLILWTAREGKELTDAVTWCEDRGLHFYAINQNHPYETRTDTSASRKVKATYYIDNHNFPGGTPDWHKIYQFFFQPEEYKQSQQQLIQNQLFQIETESNLFVRLGRWWENLKRKVL